MLLASRVQIKGTSSVTSPNRSRDTVRKSEPGPRDQADPAPFCCMESQELTFLASYSTCLNEGFWNKYSILFCMPTWPYSEYSPNDNIHRIFILLKGQRTLIKMSKLKIVWREKNQMRRENCSL